MFRFLDLQLHKQDLERADEHVEHARQLVEQQRELIVGLQVDGQSTEHAEQLLAHLVSSLEFLARHRARLGDYVDERA